MAVNNETGVLTDVAAMAEVAHRHGALLFCDAVQGFGLEPLDVGALGVDLLALSGHKVFGPKGAGALYVADGVELRPLLFGGEQERGLRPGTHATPAIVGLGAAAERAAAEHGQRREAVRLARDAFEAAAAALPGVRVNGAGAPRGVKHSNLRVDGVDGEIVAAGARRSRRGGERRQRLLGGERGAEPRAAGHGVERGAGEGQRALQLRAHRERGRRARRGRPLRAGGGTVQDVG